MPEKLTELPNNLPIAVNDGACSHLLHAKIPSTNVHTTQQTEAAERLHLLYPLISDANLTFTQALNLPTFSIGDLVLNKRVTLIAYNGIIQHYFYPVFPPDKNAENVIAWLEQHV
jgi:peroxiredoxin